MIAMWIRHPLYMLDHRWTNARLSRYLDGELSDRHRLRVERHAGRCPQCRRLLATLRRTLDGLAGLRQQHELDIAEGVIGRLRREA
jgi:predicted anti-sigma-YlaC factor YlaD